MLCALLAFLLAWQVRADPSSRLVCQGTPVCMLGLHDQLQQNQALCACEALPVGLTCMHWNFGHVVYTCCMVLTSAQSNTMVPTTVLHPDKAHHLSQELLSGTPRPEETMIGSRSGMGASGPSQDLQSTQ